MDDVTIQSAVRRFLDRALDEERVEVEVRDGVASLSGSVSSPVVRTAIEDLVRWHDGVVRLDSHLRVHAPGDR